MNLDLTLLDPSAGQPQQEFVVIYHGGGCQDGFASAWVCHKRFGDKAIYHAGSFGAPPPDIKDKIVYLVDFSYKRPVLLKMAEQAKQIIILDHHKTAKDDLVNLPSNVEVNFDMNRSGALITWEYLFKDVEVPMLIRHVSDRDLWKYELPDTKAVVAYIFSVPQTFLEWDLMFEQYRANENYRKNIVVIGESLVRQQQLFIREMIDHTLHTVTIDDVVYPAVNCTRHWGSDACHEIIQSGKDIAVYYQFTAKCIEFGMRSKEGVDCSSIALKFGGGGHPQACGFKLPLGTDITKPIRSKTPSKIVASAVEALTAQEDFLKKFNALDLTKAGLAVVKYRIGKGHPGFIADYNSLTKQLTDHHKPYEKDPKPFTQFLDRGDSPDTDAKKFDVWCLLPTSGWLKQGDLAGYLIVSTDDPDKGFGFEDNLSIIDFVIANKYQGKGYGKMLMDSVIGIYQSAGLKSCTLKVYSKNEQALGFYRGHMKMETIREVLYKKFK